MVNLYDVYIFSSEGVSKPEDAIASHIGISYGEMTDKVMATVELDLIVVITKSERNFLGSKEDKTNE